MIKKNIVFIVLLAFLTFAALPVLAQSGTSGDLNAAVNAVNAGVDAASSYGTPVSLDNPLGVSTFQQLIGKIISAILGVLGSVALLMFIWGGLVWMMAGGNEKKIAQGRDILMWAAIGLVIIFSSYAAVRFILGNIVGA
jgi:hypothetical protein